MSTDLAGTVPNRHLRYLQLSRLFARAVPFLSVLLIACGGDAGSSDEPLVNNARGGNGRSSNYSATSLPAISSFTEIRLDSLGSGFIGPPLAIADDRIAVVAGKRQLAVIRYDQLQWIYRFDEGEYPLPELAGDSTGRIYVVTTSRLLCAVDDGGRLLWKKPIGSAGTEAFDLPTWPLVVPGGVVAGTTGGLLKRFDFAGKETWSVRRGADIVRTTAFDPGMGIAFGVTHNDYAGSDTVVLLDEEGKEKWAAPLKGLRIEYGPIMIRDRVIVGVAGKSANDKYTPFIVAFDATGKEEWRASLKVLPLGIASDDDGNLYVCGGGGSRMSGGIVASFGPDGKLRWEVGLNESIPSAPITASDRVCFIAIRDRTLGLYTYNAAGGFVGFTSIESLSDIIPIPVLLPYGTLVLAGADEPVILKSR